MQSEDGSEHRRGPVGDWFSIPCSRYVPSPRETGPTVSFPQGCELLGRVPFDKQWKSSGTLFYSQEKRPRARRTMG